MAPARDRDRRTGFSRRRQYGLFLGYVLLVAGALVGAALLVVSLFDPPVFAALRMGAASVAAPVSAGAAALVRGAAELPDAVADHFHVHAENAALRAALIDQRRVVTRARAVLVENDRLRRLAGLRERGEAVVATARLVSSTASSGRRYAVLDAGRLHGVQPGMPVRAADGLIGRVVEVGPDAARVLLLTDADSVVPVRRAGDGVPAVVAGRGDGLVDVRAVNGTGNRLRRGDLFVTSGVGGLYPPGVPVVRLDAPGIDQATSRPLIVPSILDVAVVERAFFPPPAVFVGRP